jgi:hypothetical protein
VNKKVLSILFVTYDYCPNTQDGPKSNKLRDINPNDFNPFERELAQVCSKFGKSVFVENINKVKDALVFMPDVIVSTESLVGDRSYRKGLYVYKNLKDGSTDFSKFDEHYYQSSEMLDLFLERETTLQNNKHSSVELTKLLEVDKFPVDFYCKVGKRFLKILNENDDNCSFCNDQIVRYMDNGVEKFYYKSIYDDLVHRALGQVESSKSVGLIQSETDKVNFLVGTIGNLSKDILGEDQVQKQVVSSIEMTMNTLLQDKKASKMLGKVFSKENRENLTHAVATLSIGIWLLDKIDVNSEIKKSIIKKLSLASMLKDVSYSVMQREDLTEDKKNECRHPVELSKTYDEDDMKIIKNHPHLSERVARNLDKGIFCDQVCDMIKNHHEMPDGTGYPTGNKAVRMSFTTSLMIMCNYISSQLILGRGFLDIVKEIATDSKWKRSNFKKFHEVIENFHNKKTTAKRFKKIC